MVGNKTCSKFQQKNEIDNTKNISLDMPNKSIRKYYIKQISILFCVACTILRILNCLLLKAQVNTWYIEYKTLGTKYMNIVSIWKV